MKGVDKFDGMPSDDVILTYLKEEPSVIDEIHGGFHTSNRDDDELTIHLEKMDDRYYWLRVGNVTFDIKSEGIMGKLKVRVAHDDREEVPPSK